MRRPSPLPESLDPRGFAVHLARSTGLTTKRIRASDLEAPFHAVRRARGLEHDPLAAERALGARLLPSQFLSHASAARVLGMRLPWRLERLDPSVAVRAPGRAPRVAGASGHVVPRGVATVLVSGLPVTSPLDTWVSLAQRCSIDELVVIGDGLVGGRAPRLTHDDLERTVRSSAGVTGIRKLRAALPAIRERTDSVKETELRLLVTRLGFPEPEVNGRIRDASGRLLAHGDLVFRSAMTVLEYDGGQHRTDARQFAIDIRRLDDLMAAGWRVIRVDAEMLRNPIMLERKLRAALDGDHSPRLGTRHARRGP